MSNVTVSGDTSAHRMRVDRVSGTARAVLIVVANPAISSNNGWPVGFWAAELTHPYYELTEAGFEVDIASPDGGNVEFDALSDPRDPSKWSAEDLISMGFINTPELLARLDSTPSLASLDLARYEAILVAGGQSPMFTFRDNPPLQHAIRWFYEHEKVTAVYCHGVAALVDLTLADEHLKIALTPSAARAASIRFGAGNLAYLVAIGVAFLNAPASLLISGLVAVYYVFEHTPARLGTAQPGYILIPGTGGRQSPADVVPGPSEYRAR